MSTARENLQRKITTILAADIADYSRHMADDEEGTLKIFRSYRKLFEKLVQIHGGRIFNSAGDAILAEFTSAVEAVRCATEIQAALRTRNESLPPLRQLKFRIGVNLGDVLVEGRDLLGDGVNIAARIQTGALPGGVSISGSVYDQIRNKLSLSFHLVGEQKYKNIPDPVRTYAIADVESGDGTKYEVAKNVWNGWTLTAGAALLLCSVAGAAYLLGLVGSSTLGEIYAGEVCYGSSGKEPARCYAASGTLVGNDMRGRWPSRNQQMIVTLEGKLQNTGDIALGLDFIMPNNERLEMATLKGTLKGGSLLANGSFKDGRTISINWTNR